MLICHLFIFFMRYLLGCLAHFLIRWFVFLLLNFKDSLYILEKSPLSDKYVFQKDFLLGCNLSFHSLDIVYHTSVFNLTKRNLSIIFVTGCIFRVISEESSLLYRRSRRFSPLFSSRNFIVLWFTFKSTTHFELIL